MDTQELIDYIAHSKRRTPVKVHLRTRQPLAFPGAKVFGQGSLVIGDYEIIAPILTAYADQIEAIEIEAYCRNSAVGLLDIKTLSARIEPGAIIREQVVIQERAVIMMGAIVNIGAYIGKDTMIDMGAVIGGRVQIGDHCHIGAGAVLAGVIEPPSAVPVIVEDDVTIGANAVVLEGVHIHQGAVIAAGAVVIEDVAPNSVMAGIPAQCIKQRDEQTTRKTQIVEALRQL